MAARIKRDMVAAAYQREKWWARHQQAWRPVSLAAAAERARFKKTQASRIRVSKA